MNGEYTRERLEKALERFTTEYSEKGHVPAIVSHIRSRMSTPTEAEKAQHDTKIDTVILETYLDAGIHDPKTADKLHQARILIRSSCSKQLNVSDKFLNEKVLDAFDSFRVMRKKKKRA